LAAKIVFKITYNQSVLGDLLRRYSNKLLLISSSSDFALL